MKPAALKFTNVLPGDAPPQLPGLLRAATRSNTSETDPLLEGVTVEKSYRLGGAMRGTGGSEQTLAPEEPRLLALETEDGSTLFIRSDALAEAVTKLRPEAVGADGAVDLSRFRDPNATDRGLGDVLWKTVSILRAPEDALVEQAKQKALEWAKEKLGEQLEEAAHGVGSFLGAKALLWMIESRLAGRPGLYRWQEAMLDPADRCLPGDPRLQGMADGKPALLLIHGTGSYTVGGFGDLRSHAPTWDALTRRYPGGIFGYEHRTFSESPAENALALLRALPRGARVSLLTHSRGGLVGDLLCLGQVGDAAIEAYRIDLSDASDAAGLERESHEERQRLRAIRELLAAGHIQVERYVRVACPARGTRFLSENLDAALSDLLNLMQWGGGAAVGAVATALGGPVAGERIGQGASSALGVLKRLVLEIAQRRIDPRMAPGIAAMRVDSPLGRFLAHPETRRKDGIAMAVVAGDTEFDGLGFSNLRRRVANLFCDWRLFDRNDNDLVVDTESMFAGLGFRAGAHYLYQQDESVSHFRYFRNDYSRKALQGWLTEDAPDRMEQFLPLGQGRKLPWKDKDAASRGGPAGARPVVILIPGIMGSHIEVKRDAKAPVGSGDRIWFDAASLFLGKLDRIGDMASDKVAEEDLFEMFYGDLADKLAETHAVIRCPYDWRRTPDQAAATLKAKIEEAALRHPGQPIRLLAHSMGGLVARALIALHADAWNKVLTSGGRLVMLGTPNNGSHLMVHTLLGKSDSMRKLEMLDAAHGLQEILDIVAGFPGALALLPRPSGFIDAGPAEHRIDPAAYYSPAEWTALKGRISDRWYGKGVSAVPMAAKLGEAHAFWSNVLPNNQIPNPDRVAYVYGQSDKTPCGVQRIGDQLKLLFTSEGDGSVTWASGRLEGLDERSWYMPVEHADLTGEEDYFPAIVDLLEKGATDRLGRLPRRRGDAAVSFSLEAEPPVLPGEEELARAFLGSGPRRRKAARGRPLLRVSVRAGDTRFLDQPVLCGHYIGDAISGAEGALDEMLGGALAERERMGVYAGAIGTSAIVLRPPSGEEQARGSLQGAVIVGLGAFTGQLSSRQISETVRAAVMRFLLQLRDVIGRKAGDPVTLHSVLIGWGSSASVSVEESVTAVTRGVLEANQQFIEAAGKGGAQALAVTDLVFIELYRDAAISAARAALDLSERLAGDLKRLGVRIAAAPSMVEGAGALERLNAASDLGHWARLIISDADAPEVECAPECYETRCKSPIPPEQLEKQCGKEAAPGPAEDKPPTPCSETEGDKRRFPERLRYLFLSQRARAETVWQRRQPGLVEKLIETQRHNPGYDPQLGQTLFQLMVPLDFKAAARDQARLLLILDAHAASLPWEMLQADGEPLVLRTPMVRQLATMRFRASVRTASTNSACIIANPSTYGYCRRFPGALERLPDLPGAVREGDAVAAALRAADWTDITQIPPERAALDIFNALYARPYRVLMIGAHGIFEARARDGNVYSGVVLSDGLLLSAVEIGQMEVTPELVFLSCCHLGSINTPGSQPNRLAYSLARELIEMGARCVVAAGWEVDDEAACTFASTFFQELTQGRTFGDALFAARKAARLQHPASNTWGAFQAYGDPGYRLRPDGGAREDDGGRPYVAIAQLLSAIQRRRVARELPGHAKAADLARQQQWARRQLARCPADWAERPDVLQALGELYADTGAEGFHAAREAYLQAIRGQGANDRVHIRAIEQLANLEARHGGKLADKGDLDAGLKFIESGLQRMLALDALARGDGEGNANPERAGILGSAWKLKAAALARKNTPSAEEIAQALKAAARAYLAAIEGDPARSPYHTLNALPLAWLTDSLSEFPQANTLQPAIDLALRCGQGAREKFKTSKDFWDAVMSVDAEMTAWLLGAPLDAGDPEEHFQRRYQEAAAALPGSALQWDSVAKQWRLLAAFTRLCRNQDADALLRAEQLDRLADRYLPPRDNGAPPAAPAKSAKPARKPRKKN